jgi:hypothetical protein
MWYNTYRKKKEKGTKKCMKLEFGQKQMVGNLGVWMAVKPHMRLTAKLATSAKRLEQKMPLFGMLKLARS